MQQEEPKRITRKFLASYFELNQKESAQLQQKLERKVFQNNEAIVVIGDKADYLYFIEEGRASVFNEQGEDINEMQEGQIFGEYAILADKPRLSTVRAHGKVVTYRLKAQDFLRLVAKHPQINGRLLEQAYSQITVKHTKLVSMTRRQRGIMWSPNSANDQKLSVILLTYGITALVLLFACILAPNMTESPVWWQVLPVAFLLLFTLRTKRVVEGMLLTVLLLGGMLYRGNFVKGFIQILREGIGNVDTASTIIIMGMVEAMAALLAAAGVVSAFKKIAEKHMNSMRKSLFGMLMIMIVVCIDEGLNVITAGFCTNEMSDRNQTPRETKAVLGSFSMAICSIIPFSLWSSYLVGWIEMYYENGGTIFLQAILFNLVGVFGIISAVLLCLGLLPKSGTLKRAYERVNNGGKLWPDGSEVYFAAGESDGVIGKPMNLILPMLVWVGTSIGFGVLENNGEFSLDATSGLVVTLIFMFVFYIGRRFMTPKTYFETMAAGIGNALMPILLLVLSERIAACLEQLGFDHLLEHVIVQLVFGQLELIPAVLFVFCTVICLVMGSCWGMYGLGIPVCVYLSGILGLNVPLCLGATLAAGVLGESLCPYFDDTAPVVTVIGCEPVVYRKLRFQYWLPIAALSTVGYVILGIVCR